LAWAIMSFKQPVTAIAGVRVVGGNEVIEVHVIAPLSKLPWQIGASSARL
jgi:hypothetical protein